MYTIVQKTSFKFPSFFAFKQTVLYLFFFNLKAYNVTIKSSEFTENIKRKSTQPTGLFCSTFINVFFLIFAKYFNFFGLLKITSVQ